METERILLRPWQDSDAETLFKYASDPEVGPHAGWPPHKSVEESLEIIRTVFNAEGMWAVIWKKSGEPMEQREQSDAGINSVESRQRSTEGQPIGCVGYLPASASNLKIAEDQAEVGYWIARPYWGKGICTEALRMVIDYCFNEKNGIISKSIKCTLSTFPSIFVQHLLRIVNSQLDNVIVLVLALPQLFHHFHVKQ